MTSAAHYAELEARLRNLLNGMADLPDDVRNAVAHYIDHNEYGLAADTFGDSVMERDIPLSSEAVEEMARLYELMRAEPRNIELLRQRSHT